MAQYALTHLSVRLVRIATPQTAFQLNLLAAFVLLLRNVGSEHIACHTQTQLANVRFTFHFRKELRWLRKQLRWCVNQVISLQFPQQYRNVFKGQKLAKICIKASQNVKLLTLIQMEQWLIP